MYDLSFATQINRDRNEINDALGVGRVASTTGAPPTGVPIAAGPLGAAGAPGGPPPPPGAPSLAAMQVGAPGGPGMGAPPQMSPLQTAGAPSGMGTMTQSRGPIFQVNPSQQAPGQAAAPRLFARGGHVNFAVMRTS